MRRTLQITCFLLLGAVTINAQQDISSFDANLKRGDTLVFQSKFDEAITLFNEMMKRNSSDPLSKIILLNKLSSTHAANKELDKALKFGEQARKESIRIKAKDQEAEALDNMGIVYRSREVDLEEALRLHNEALSIQIENVEPDSLAIANTYYNIGCVLGLQGKYEKSLEAFEKSNAHITDGSIAVKTLKLAIGDAFALTYSNLGRTDDALLWLQKTLRLAKSSLSDDESPFFIKLYNKLGILYSSKDLFYLSLQYYNKALNLSISNYGYDHPDQLRIHYNIGSIHYQNDDNDKAIFHGKKSLEMAMKEFGEGHINLFYMYSLLGVANDDELGLEYLDKALQICLNNVGENHLLTAATYSYIHQVNLNIGRLEKALEYAHKVLKIRLSLLGEKNLNTIHSYNHLSLIYLMLKNYKEALIYNEKAISSNLRVNDKSNSSNDIYNLQNVIHGNALLGSLTLKSDVFVERYSLSKNPSDLEQGILLNKEALVLVNRLRKKKTDYNDQMAFSELVKNVYAQSIKTNLLLSELNEDNELLESIFQYSQQSKAYTLGQTIAQNEAKQNADLPESILITENKIDSIIANIQSEIASIKSKASVDSTRLYQWEGKLLGINQRKDSLELAIEKEYPKYYSLKYAKNIVSVKNIQNKLDDSTTFLEFFKAEETVFAFIITKNTFKVHSLEVPELDGQVKELQEIIIAKNESDFFMKSQELYKQLISPLREDLKGDQLIIAPDGSTWHVPFDVLITKKYEPNSDTLPSYFIEDFAVSYVNSARFLFDKPNVTTAKSDLKGECLAFSYTGDMDSIVSTEGNLTALSLQTLRNSKEDLPGTRKEIRNLSQIFQGSYYYDGQANELNFKSEAANYRIIHLALHGDIDHRNPKNSMLYFSPLQKEGFPEDNVLYNHELFAMDIPADLVVLSACNTGTGQLNSGEGIASLGQSFQYARTKSLLLSRWEVSDKVAPQLMQSFYANLKSGLDKSRALQRAKLDFLQNSNEFSKAPFYWGNFYLLGDANAIEFESGSTLNYWLMLVLGVLIVLYFISKKLSVKTNT